MVLGGDEFELSVEVKEGEDPAEMVIVNDLNSYSKQVQRNTQTYPVFKRQTPHSTSGAREQTYSLGGYLNPDDPGQQALLAAEETNTPIKIQVLFNSTDGFSQLVGVNSLTHDADPEGLQEISFELTAKADATKVGNGPII